MTHKRDIFGRILNENSLIFSNEQKEFFDGIMAGDGNLTMKENACFIFSGKHKEFAEYIKNYLSLSTAIHTYKKPDDRLIDGYYITNCISKQNNYFNDQYKRWYKHDNVSNKNIKCLPDDFLFSPISILALYLSDGFLHKSGSIQICTECFDKDSVIKIITNRLDEIGIKCWMNKRKRIYISTTCKDIFLNFIGKCPVSCYNYKWNKNFDNIIDTDKIRNGSKTKLSYNLASEIRNKFLIKKYYITSLAKEYGVDDKTICDVVYNRTWPDKNYDCSIAKNIAKSNRSHKNG